jgi:hypothetical protein
MTKRLEKRRRAVFRLHDENHLPIMRLPYVERESAERVIVSRRRWRDDVLHCHLLF